MWIWECRGLGGPVRRNGTRERFGFAGSEICEWPLKILRMAGELPAAIQAAAPTRCRCTPLPSCAFQRRASSSAGQSAGQLRCGAVESRRTGRQEGRAAYRSLP
jgi:hypothetical protein